MTWSAHITDGDGNSVSCYADCKHVDTCQVHKMAGNIGPILTSIDTGCDGHMASGTANLQCAGYEAKDLDGDDKSTTETPGASGGDVPA